MTSSFIKNKKITIIGGAGFIGHNLCLELKKKTDTKPSDVSLESWVYEIKKILSTVSLPSV